MDHATPLITTIVAGLVLAFVAGLIAHRLRLPPIAGYLLAGVLIGPFTPGYVADQKLATELAEIGVILLMFGVGLHFSLKDLLSVRSIAIPGAIGQIAVATLFGMLLALALGWPPGTGFVFGLSLSVASTVVLLRALQERRMVETEKGRIAVGWLIVEDLVMVLTLVLLPPLAGMLGGTAEVADADPALTQALGIGAVWTALGVTALKVTAFVALMLIVGRKVIPWVLHYVAHTGSRELFRLAVLAIALGVDLNLLPEIAQDFVVAGALLSILVNPLLFLAVDRYAARIEREKEKAKEPVAAEPVAATAENADISKEEAPQEDETDDRKTTTLSSHAILVGFGRVGSRIGETLLARGVPLIVIEERSEATDALRERGVEVISDMAGNRGILDLANVAGARWFISAIPDAFEAGTLIEQARSANPKLEIIARAHSDAEVDHLAQLGADRILMGEEEIARGMSGHVLDDLDAPAATVVAEAAADPLEPQPNVEIGGADPAPEADAAQDLPAGTPEGGDKPA